MGRVVSEVLYYYHVFQQAWNCYLWLVSIDYGSTFACSICIDQPSIIILDGIAMGTTKQIPETPNFIDEQQKLPINPLANRVFTDNAEARKMLGQYIDSGLIDTNFDMMLANLNIPEFASYLRFTSQTSDSLRLVDPEFPGVIEAIKLLARSEPLTALFRFSALSGFQRKMITELSLGESKSIESLSDIYHKTYGLNIIFNSISPKIDPLSRKITLQSHVALLLKMILKKVNL